MLQLPTKILYTPEQARFMETVRVATMGQAPFFAYYFYRDMEEYPTLGIPTMGTDSKRLFVNPVYVCKLAVQEGVFGVAHELYHATERHPQRMKYYAQQGHLRGLPWNAAFFNICADFCINADLVDMGVGQINPSWLLHPKVKGHETVEDVYVRLWKDGPGKGRGKGPPPNQPGGGNCDQPGGGEGDFPTNTAKDMGKQPRNSRPDKTAEQNGGRFDEVFPPFHDLVSGKDDAPTEGEHKEAIASAAAAAKAVGKLPANIQRRIDALMEPKTPWKEHIRISVTKGVGARKSSYERPNRRRLVLDPIIVMPGRKPFGAGVIAVAYDTSGSISKREHDAWFSETGGIIQDIKPRNIIMMWCDCQLRRVEWVKHMDEMMNVAMEPTPGGGGTSFIPPFEYLKKEGITPDVMIYLTDMLGPFPADPGYHTIWVSTTQGAKAPFGEVIYLDI